MSELSVGDEVSIDEIDLYKEFDDWGEEYDGRYTYALIEETDDGVIEYHVAIESFEVMNKEVFDE